MLQIKSVEDASDFKTVATESAKTDFLATIFPEVVCNIKGVDGFDWSLKVT